jgi:hypothetical protein
VTPWDDAWLNGKPMPPHALPKVLLIEAQAIAEEWLIALEIRSIIEEWAARDRAEDAVWRFFGPDAGCAEYK